MSDCPEEDLPDETGDDAATLALTVAAPARLDKALAEAQSRFSRSRITQLIVGGAVRDAAGDIVSNPALKARAGERYLLTPPPVAPATPEPEAIALDIAYEDASLIVVNKPVGMVVHPAPGAERGTLVAALLHHCGASLSGIGGVARPGIVHRIDKDTSGLLVVAKTDAAHAALSAQFAAHDLERSYLAVARGAPDRADARLAGLPAVSFEPGGVVRVEAPLARSRSDRKKMAVDASGRRAVTRIETLERFGSGARPVASLIRCRLETGRTHQIRVHLSHIGHPLAGDQTYGRGRGGHALLDAFPRQALHAATLGFLHPDDGRPVRFEAPPPEDFAGLIDSLKKI